MFSLNIFNSTGQCFSILSEKLRNLGNFHTEVKTVGHRISLSDNLQKLKFGVRFCGRCMLPW